MPVNLTPSNSDTRKFKVATIQAEPSVFDCSAGYHPSLSSLLSVWLDLRGGVDKTIRLIKEAAGEGAKIVGFPEVFIPGAIPFASHSPRTGLEPDADSTSPGYPWTPWANSFLESKDILAKYQANSMGLHSPEMAEIQAVAKATGSWVVLGFSERDGGSLYIVCFIGPKSPRH